MGVRDVLRYPHPALKQVARPLEAHEGPEIERVAADLVDTMRATVACVGLAAPQIGVDLRAFVVDVTGHRKARSCHGELVLFDPELVSAEAPEVAREGCLSIPDLTGDVARGTEVVVRGIGVDGAERVVEADAFEARALLHELDHLDGLLFLDRVDSLRIDVFRRKRQRT